MGFQKELVIEGMTCDNTQFSFSVHPHLLFFFLSTFFFTFFYLSPSARFFHSALRQADNNQESAVNLLTQSPDLLVQAATMATESRSSNNKKNVDMSENKV